MISYEPSRVVSILCSASANQGNYMHGPDEDTFSA
jgi:hypothetical protein